MTYFGFLARFLVIPMIIVALLLWRDHRKDVATPPYLRNFAAWAAILAHIIIAVVYTTPWDNYLVATSVWWYDPALVTGITLGWVPIEEYTFFVLQTWLTGMWLVWLTRRLPPAQQWTPSGTLRTIFAILLTILWLPFVLFLIQDVEPATYISLILAWALPPIILQIAFGADILWRYRNLVFTTIAVPTIFLALADTLAIQIGIWTISPEQTTGIHFPGGLPLEEFLFFLVTNVLVGFGVTLMLAQESIARVPWLKRGATAEGADA